MRIIFTGGGTGGHVFPLLATIRELKKLYYRDDLEIIFMGPKDKTSDELFSQEGVEKVHILSGKMRRYATPQSIVENIIDLGVKIPIGFLQSLLFFFFKDPDIIFTKGGYGSLPVALAGKCFFTPLVLHESDAVAGVANMFLAKHAKAIFVSFATTKFSLKEKTFFVGNPIRRELNQGSVEDARTRFGLESTDPVILVLGGSQGSQRVNDFILNILPSLLKNFQVLHQCGTRNYTQVAQESSAILGEEQQKRYRPVAFFSQEDLAHAYAISDLIVSRAGSGSIFEIAYLGKPAILIPLPEAAQNHQAQNAYEYAKTGAAVVVEESNLAPHFFLQIVHNTLQSKEKLAQIKEAAYRFSHQESATLIARFLTANA
jgi:UDP-N-acetylglucosamine--N-acetylmuramyl-(pentapeptide) pyrophosphoryl-undecaprenol N-acetylglucosamine transferase